MQITTEQMLARLGALMLEVEQLRQYLDAERALTKKLKEQLSGTVIDSPEHDVKGKGAIDSDDKSRA